MLSKYSGFLIIFFTWFFLVFPFFYFRKGYKLKTISEMICVPGLGNLINIGFVGAGVSQVVFAIYLFRRFLEFVDIIGIIIFVVGSILLASESIISVKLSGRIHLLIARLYFLFISIGALLISISFWNIDNKLSVFNSVLSLTMLVSVWFFAKKGNFLKAELIGVVFSSLWGLIFYFTVI